MGLEAEESNFQRHLKTTRHLPRESIFLPSKIVNTTQVETTTDGDKEPKSKQQKQDTSANFREELAA